MKRTLLLTAILSLAAAHLCASDREPFLASVLEAGQRQNLRRTASIDPPPTRRPPPGSGKALVTLKLPSLGEKREGRMRIVEVDGAGDGSLNFDMSRTELTAPDIDIPGLVSPELLALDQYSFSKFETPAKFPLFPDPETPPEQIDAMPASRAGSPVGDDALPDSPRPEKNRRPLHYAGVEVPSTQTIAPVKRREPAPTFPQGSLKPPPAMLPPDTAFQSLAPPESNRGNALALPLHPDPVLPELTPLPPFPSEPTKREYQASSREYFPAVPNFEWPPSPLNAIAETRNAVAERQPAVDADGFVSMREFRNVLAPVYRKKSLSRER